ncbi:MAG: 5'/3'-nucleotidase SurE [Anaerolineae bacterium]|nr:5'/3'-nucleotidase SurE [Anaerolineae bacterium]
MERPLILVTNDDGFESEGLWAAVESVLSLGEVLVIAPDRQWSGAGRSMPQNVTGQLVESVVNVGDRQVKAYAVDATPALAVVHGVTELAPRRPALVVSGINFGANLGIEVTISGTVGAALEGGAFGIPAMAVSLEMDQAYHLSGNRKADYTAAKAFTQQFAQFLLDSTLPYDVHALNINIPRQATASTAWWLTRLSQRRYFEPLPPDRANGQGRPGYKLLADPEQAELDSDVWAVLVDHVVSVTPLSLDLTARVELGALHACLLGEITACFNAPEPWLFPLGDPRPVAVP